MRLHGLMVREATCRQLTNESPGALQPFSDLRFAGGFCLAESGRPDLNRGLSAPKTDALPSCATPRAFVFSYLEGGFVVLLLDCDTRCDHLYSRVFCKANNMSFKDRPRLMSTDLHSYVFADTGLNSITDGGPP